MVSFDKFIYVYALISLFNPIFSQQSYDKSSCLSVSQVPGSNYLCNSKKTQCDTFLVYRAQEKYQTLSSIASLFNLNQSTILPYNNVSDDHSRNLQPGQEVIIPITCSCMGQFSQAVFAYNASGSDSLSSTACQVFEGLVKAQVLIEENQYFSGNNCDFQEITVPIRCACPDEMSMKNGVNYLLTYSIFEKDQTKFMAQKFGVTNEMILAANRLDTYAAIFPQTTLIIPMEHVPVVNWDVSFLPENSSPSPMAVTPLKNIVGGTSSNTTRTYLFLGSGLFAAASIVIGAICYVSNSIRRRNHHRSFQPLSPRTSRLSDFSPDFLDGMSKLKHSLMNFSLEELRIATEDFSKASMIGTSVYKGRLNGSKLAIEQMSSEEAVHHVINILTKINHLNVVKLDGCCYGPRPYLVFEFAENGSLRNCLSNPKMAKQLTWIKRLQIAFDLAVGLHYIHYCTKPAYVHRNINSRNVLITTDWRAKISGFRLAKPLVCIEEKEEINWNESVIVGRKGYLATEYLTNGLASLTMDVFAFGVVLLELLSSKEAVSDGVLLKDSVMFLAYGGVDCSSEWLDKLKGFMDPALEGDYPLGDAMCLALLAKGCVEDDPQHRPTMNDVLKALSRIF